MLALEEVAVVQRGGEEVDSYMAGWRRVWGRGEVEGLERVEDFAGFSVGFLEAKSEWHCGTCEGC